ncbi:MAG TPA: ABC transporter ATP-binding protein, partial [Limnochordia bacterium]|nr:ABC transporter ATP-binding protein [Limnochordia bacterium]
APGAVLILFLQHLLEGLEPALGLIAMQRLIDTGIAIAGQGPARLGALLPWLGLYVVALLASPDMLWRLRDTLMPRLEQRLEARLGRRVLAKAAALPLVFFETSATYDQLRRAEQPGAKLRYLFFAFLYFLRSLIQAIGVAALFWSISPWLTAALLLVVVPQTWLQVMQSRQFMGFHYGRTQAQRRAHYLERLITGRHEQKELRVFTLSGALIERWQGLLAGLREEGLGLQRRHALGALGGFAFGYAVSLGTAVWLAWALARRALTPGGFVALFRAIDQLDHAASSIGYCVREMHTRAVDAGYVRELLALPEPPPPAARRPWPSAIRAGIRFENVTFAYPGERASVLSEFNLQLRAGERVALVGANGAGKSTLVKLLLGLYRPQGGRITVDGVDLDAIDPDERRRHVVAVFQDYYNFEFTAAQAIALGDPASFRAAAGDALGAPDAARVHKAAVLGGADAVFARLPRGPETPVGHVRPGGQGLSGGQWQRLAISRAFMREPSLLILDEPTAALDPQAEADVYARFASALGGRTGLLISHRLGSARLADRIVVLAGGRVVEDGDHAALLAKGGEYARMWEVQSQWYR